MDDTLRKMDGGMDAPATRPSTTLYVTTTLLTGETGRFTDAMGTLVQDSDQHGLFTFTEDDLATMDIEGALAVAGRSTSSFPGAFEPAFVPYDTATRRDGEVRSVHRCVATPTPLAATGSPTAACSTTSPST